MNAIREIQDVRATLNNWRMSCSRTGDRHLQVGISDLVKRLDRALEQLKDEDSGDLPDLSGVLDDPVASEDPKKRSKRSRKKRVAS